MNVFFPSVDDGVDLICANGCRVQVKTARLLSYRSHAFTYPEGVYKFYFGAVKHVAKNSQEVRRIVRPPIEQRCDVVAMWGVEENRFWIVPARTLKGSQGIHVGPSKGHSFEKDMPEIRAMVEMGMSQAEIGKHLGLRQSTIGRRIQTAGKRRDCESIRFAVQECENAWDNIVNFGFKEPLSELLAIPVSFEGE